MSGGTIRYLGRISYGTYLWHWPVIVFARHLGDFSAWELAGLSAVIGTSLAALSNEILEMPIRTSAWLDRRAGPVIIVGVLVGLVLGLVYVPAQLGRDRAPVVADDSRTVVAVPQETRREWGRVPTDIDWEALALRKAPEPPDCEGRPARDCIVVRGSGAHIHLVGDSHARMVLPTFTRIARGQDMTLSASYDQGCPWQKGLLLTNDAPKGMASCTAHHKDQYERVIPKLDPDVVVVMAVARDDPHLLPRGKANQGGTEGLSRATARAFEELTVDGRRVVILEPTPVWPFDPLSCLSAAKRVAACAFKPTPSPLESEVVYRYHALDKDIFSIELDSIACPELPVCVPMREGTVSFRDKTHFGATFARRIAGQVHKRFERAGVFDDLPGS